MHITRIDQTTLHTGYICIQTREKGPSKKNNRNKEDENEKGANESDDGPEGESSNPSRRGSGFKSRCFRPSMILTEIDRGLDPNIKLVRALSTLIHWVHGVSTREGPTISTTRRLPSVPKVDRTSVSGDDSFARQRPLIGDSLNDEERSDDLQSYQITMFEGRRTQGEKARTCVSARMGRNMSATWLPAPQGPTNNNELAA